MTARFLTVLAFTAAMTGSVLAQDYSVSSQPYPPQGSTADYDDGSQPAMSADHIAGDVKTRFNSRTGAREQVAPTFDPFELDTDLASSVHLRSAGDVRDLNNAPFSDGALLDISLFYNQSGEPDFGRTRDALFLNGEAVPIILRDGRELECSSRVTETVYHSNRYYSPGYGGLYRSPPIYLGYSFGGHGWYDRGYDRWRRFGAQNRYRDRNRARYRDRYRDRYRNRGRAQVPPAPRPRDRGPRSYRDGQTDNTRNSRPRYRDRNASGDAIREWNPQPRRLRNRDNTRRPPRRQRSESRQNLPDTVVRPQQQDRRPVMRERRSDSRPASPPVKPRPQPRVEPRQPETRRAEPRRAEPRRIEPRRSEPRQLERSIEADRLEMFPNGRGESYVISSERDCAREDRMTLFIPNERLEAARFDGLTIIVRDVSYNPRNGQTTVYDERPLYVPGNYVQGFLIARARP